MIWIDYAILGIVALSILLGLWRGFVREALSLVAWVVAFWVALRFSPYLADSLAGYIPIPALQTGIAFAVIFVVTLMILGLANWLVVKLIRGAGLGIPDRIIGMVFGALRGVLLATVAVVLMGLTPLVEQDWWTDSATVGYCRQLAGWIGAWIPGDIADRLLRKA
ncbi:MAG: membrane protein required for colicin V production [Gammaproteobacteria bacterium]|nr:MAG: membrane protein required for colicin V production [Gammaproteobacteria bacterium]TND07392.1 MAG: membrane protein required for colicin V production [Gammaproteobacteria bacterium]